MRSRWFLLLLLAVFASAQELREQITVDIVEVPVHVIRHGKAVAGLTQHLFELSVNGKPHPIEYFDVIDARGVALPAVIDSPPDVVERAAAPPLERRTLTLLLFDTTATSHRHLVRGSEAAQKFVKEAPRSETFAVARLNADGVQFLVPFTTDRVAVLRAVRTLQPSRARDILGLATLDTEREGVLTAVAPGSLEGVSDPALDGLTTAGLGEEAAAAINRARTFSEESSAQVRADRELRVAHHLGSLADKLAAVDGVKHVIFFSEGGRRVAEPNSAARMHAKFHAAGVILDAVELDPMRIPGLVDAERRLDDSLWAAPRSRMPVDRSEPLQTLALGTGGTVARHSDLVRGLRLLREIQGVTYILGFRPPETDRTHNEISVKVKNQPRGTTVTYRRGYGTGPLAKRNEGLFLADVIMNDIAQRGLTVNLNVTAAKDGTNVMVSVPGKELLAREVDGPQTEVDVFLYVFNERNAVAEWAYWRLLIDLEKGRPYLMAFPYEIERLFTTLGRGRYSAKALLRFVNSDVIAFQRTDFEIAAK